MWDAIRRNMTVKQIVVWSTLLLFGIFLFIIGLLNITYVLTGNATDLNRVVNRGDEPKKLDVVELDIQYVLSDYAEENRSLMGIKFKTKYHFIVVLEDGSLISLSVNDEEYVHRLYNLASYTQNYVYGYSVTTPTPLHITGVITGMSSKCKQLYQDALEYMGLDIDSKYVYTLEIDTTKTRGMMTAAFCIGIFMMIAGFLYYKSCQKEKQFKKEQFASVGTSSLDPLSAMIQNRENETINREANEEYNDKEENVLDFKRDEPVEIQETTSGTSKFTLKKD